MKFSATLNAFIELFFPRTCVVCGDKLMDQETFICLKCQVQIPRTGFHLQDGNKMEELFYGRCEIERACAFFEFQKGSDYQKILHQLKYRGLDSLGIHMGKLYALELKDSDFIKPIDIICPVPLHPKKERKRGYNQSYQIALGLSGILNIPTEENLITREINTKTQTRKNRFERWQNVDGIFGVANPKQLQNKHILLVDDVITTGSTLEACIYAIKKHPTIKVSVLTLAIA